MTDRRVLLRRLPAIDRLLNMSPLADLAGRHAHVQLRTAAQAAVDDLRQRLLAGEEPPPDTTRITSYNVCYTKLLRSCFEALEAGHRPLQIGTFEENPPRMPMEQFTPFRP